MSVLKSIRIAKGLAVLTLLAMSAPMTQAQDLSLPQIGSDPVRLRLSGTVITPETAADMLRVYVGAPELCCDDRTPIAGRYGIKDNALTFTPAFGFETRQDYAVRMKVPGKDARLVAFRLASGLPGKDAAITEIYPSGDTLPENLLRFYLHFSVPMQPHVAFDFIKLRDAFGKVDDAAFMRFKQELWNADRTRLTVLFDPGRIKREVATNRELGPALRAGHQYTLEVKGAWPSADGTTILRPFAKTFWVSDALRSRPDTRHWTVNTPCRGTVEPLEIAFDRPFDRHLLPHALRLRTTSWQGVEGTAHIGDSEYSWRFTPDLPWSEQELQVVVDPALEDVAGNNYHDLLDHLAPVLRAETSPTELSIDLPDC